MSASWPLGAQSQLSGRVHHPRYEGGEPLYCAAVMVFASQKGGQAEARGFRTWETHPAGWYLIAGPPGEYTVWFTQPGGFFRPQILSPVILRDGEKLDGRDVTPSFDYACFYEGAWDSRPATEYYQVFTARGHSLTAVGIRLAHDGVDGQGPGSQTLVATVHRAGAGTPDQWPQVGPPGVIPKVDCGGAKNYAYATAWDSGEVPLIPGEKYAIRLRAEKEGGVMQTFWRTNTAAEPSLYRVGKDGSRGWGPQQLWLAVATDAEGWVIPYNKKVHLAYQEFAGFAQRWSQTYVARGRSLAGVLLHAAVGGAQPPLSRQRVVVRVRQGGPEGPVVGVEKIAIGNGNYTGDASWGMFGAAYARGEVPLTPGATYALEFESIENYETLHGFVNIKGDVSDDRPGFNPYKKVAPDDYAHGTAYKLGREAMPFDLDMQVVEYLSASAPPPGPNLLRQGDMQAAEGELPAGWTPFKVEPATRLVRFADGPANTNFTARVVGGSATGARADGGFVQQVGGLNRFAAYRLTGKIRSSWPLDWQHQTMVGIDPTGQTENPDAPTVQWSKGPLLHGVYVDYRSEPVRPQKDRLSIWLRGRTTMTNDYRFTADFDDFALREILE
ncbi:MAG: carboxypeptidase-like regulatory domain-containing protein [Verrucomicrobiae bacterium]|nr:carboxypeptidase-like regulatory domain-containing protein [Verrucomicrobiae bacterium]